MSIADCGAGIPACRRLSSRRGRFYIQWTSAGQKPTDRQADTFLEQRVAMERAAIDLRVKYVPLFRKVLSAKSTALFFQIEWRLNLMIDAQWASEIPLIDRRGYDPAAAQL
jgi:hypothetical protein